MNDSFLEDLELVPVEQKTGSAVHHAERFITARYPLSPTITLRTPQNEPEVFIQHQGKSASSVMPKGTGTISLDQNLKRKSKDKDKLIVIDSRKQLTSVKTSSPKLKNTKPKDDKLKQVENVDRTQTSKYSATINDRIRPTSSRENSRLSDGSSKENSRPDSSAESNNSELAKDWRKISGDNMKKKFDEDSLPMLNAIKEIVSGYTKMESTKIMRMMQDHYINSQANLMKQLLIMTDDLQELGLNKESSRVEALAQENNQLLENIRYLKSRVEELQKMVDFADKIRQENIALKLRIQELEK